MKLETRNFTVNFKSKIILDNINFKIEKGEKVFLLGHNGAGKSTFAKALMGLISFEGKILFNNKEISSKTDWLNYYKHVNYVFQNVNEQLFLPTVIDELIFGPINFGYSIKEAKSLAKYYLKYFEIEHLENTYIHELSGGEKRLVALCSILTFQPDIIILDEPTNDLDKKNLEKFLNFLKHTDQGILLITHHSFIIKSFSFWKKYYLKDGKLLDISEEKNKKLIQPL